MFVPTMNMLKCIIMKSLAIWTPSFACSSLRTYAPLKSFSKQESARVSVAMMNAPNKPISYKLLQACCAFDGGLRCCFALQPFPRRCPFKGSREGKADFWDMIATVSLVYLTIFLPVLHLMEERICLHHRKRDITVSRYLQIPHVVSCAGEVIDGMHHPRVCEKSIRA